MKQAMQPYALATGEGESIWFLGSLITIKATSAETCAGFGLIEQVLPVGFAPPLHVHHHEDEAFYVLEGEITFHCGDKEMAAKAGAYIFFPRNIPHWFLVQGEQPARLLQFTFPGGLESFFAEIGEPAGSLTLPQPVEIPIKQMPDLAPKYDLEILGPPPINH